MRPAPFSNTPLTDAELNARTVDVIGDLDSLNGIYFPKTDLVSAINAVPGVMSKTFYVDQVNGSDTNNGSQSAPFQTLQKAIDSVPVGGIADIRLKEGQTFTLTQNIHVKNKKIKFNRWGLTPGVSNPVITSTEFSSGSYDGIYNFRVDSSVINLDNVDVVIPTHAGTQSIHLGDRALFIPLYNGYGISVITFHYNKITLNKDFRLIDPYNHGGGHEFFATQFWGTTIEVNDTNAILIHASSWPFAVGALNVSIEDNTQTGKTFASLLAGIVRDANGVPRNVISNLVL